MSRAFVRQGLKQLRKWILTIQVSTKIMSDSGNKKGENITPKSSVQLYIPRQTLLKFETD